MSVSASQPKVPTNEVKGTFMVSLDVRAPFRPAG